MPDDGVIQLRRNHSKQAIAGPHPARHGKGNKSSARMPKYSGANSRKAAELQRTPSTSSINQGNGATDNDTADTAHHAHSRAQGAHHRLNKGQKPNIGVGSGVGIAFSSHRYRGLSGLGNLAQSHRKPVIQLEKEEEDEPDGIDTRDDSGNEDFEDYDDEEAEEAKRKMSSPTRESTHLNIGIQPVEPSPAKLSEETVISVSSLADMASALEGARNKSAFVGEDDLISTAVNRSKNLGNMARMVRGWNSSAQLGSGSTGSRQSPRPNNGAKGHVAIPGEDDPREFEKVFREYTNARAITNPVINSLFRISASQDTTGVSLRGGSASAASSINGDSANSNGSITGLQLPSIKKVNSLVATTADQMSDFSDRGTSALLHKEYSGQSHGAIESVSTYTLNKIWQMGWADPEYPRSSSAMRARMPTGIHGQAMKVQQQLASARERKTNSSQSSANT